MKNNITGEDAPPDRIGGGLNPRSVLGAAIKKVPAVKYALGIAGVAAAVAIIRTLTTDLRVAVFGIVLMLFLMTVLFIFSRLTSVPKGEMKWLLLTMSWFSLLLTIATASLLFTSVFFKWPLDLEGWVSGKVAQLKEDRKVGEEAGVQQVPSNRTQQTNQVGSQIDSDGYLRGKVMDKAGDPLPGAVVEIDEIPNRTFTTDSNGGFFIKDIPTKLGSRARVYVSKEGYKTYDEYVTLPGPARFWMERK